MNELVKQSYYENALLFNPDLIEKISRPTAEYSVICIYYTGFNKTSNRNIQTWDRIILVRGVFGSSCQINLISTETEKQKHNSALSTSKMTSEARPE